MDKKRIIEEAWLGLGDTSKIKINNPLGERTQEDKDFPGLREMRLMRDPRYLSFTADTLFNIDLLPDQDAILEEVWRRPFPMFVASRGFGKSFLLALYTMMRLALTPPAQSGGAGVKIVIVGAAFRQSKVIFEYMETIWRNSPILRSICDTNSGPRRDVDRCTMRINENWAIAIPIGDGSKIRGLRANIIICDEFSSIPPDIYETVIQGFAAVSSDPVQNVKEYASRQARKEFGMWSEEDEEIYQAKEGNQIIISGTADYSFKHYADYWRRYCGIIHSQGREKSLAQWFDDDEGVPEHFDWKHFSVIRFPYKLIPKGFMDDKIITRAKATVHSGVFQKEYGCVFTADSSGFFKRSLIESCVAQDSNIKSQHWPIWCPTVYDAVTRGNLTKQYVYGIDPASEADNFSIVILEVNPGHQRIVYCWTTNRDDFKTRQKNGLTKSADFYGFCAQKIRELLRTFPPATTHPLGAAIGMDAQGGGIAVIEALHDPDKMDAGDVPIWPIIEDPTNMKDTDLLPGMHMVELVQFARADWTGEANHGLRKDMEDKLLLFPRFDPLSLEMAVADDVIRSKKFQEQHNKELIIYDSLEDCVMEIEELKDELTTIVMTRTGTGVGGRDRWDTPEVKIEGGKKGRLRKDRYSSLVMANMVARQLVRAPAPIEYQAIGGFTKDMKPGKNSKNQPLYTGPEWFTKSMETMGGGILIKRH